MKILVINAGSSSLKYQLIDTENSAVLARGLCERINEPGSRIVGKLPSGEKFVEETVFKEHGDAFKKLLEVLTVGEHAVLESLDELSAVGHRIVQGAEIYTESVLVTEEVIKNIETLGSLAPLHNIPEAQAIRACVAVLGEDIPQVVVFDTSFHATMPEKAYMFGIPYEYYEKYHIRRYGFHGTSHRYISAKAADLLGKDIKDTKIVTCHLGNGCSITAVDGGVSVDTSMGFTPLDGFIMGTRSGGIDPSIVTFLMEKENLTPQEMDTILNKKSGYLGISGKTNDHRDLCDLEAKGDKRAALALRVQRYQIKKFIGSYIAAMGGCDAVVFTGGIGENVPIVRKEVCENMDYLGLTICDEANDKAKGVDADISTSDSKARIFVITTDEEMVIAKDTFDIVTSL